jgi:hypothetical protein
MISRSLIRRLERLENRLGNNHKWGVRVESYDISPDGTLVRLPHSDDEGTEAGQTIRVLYVDSDGNGRPGPCYRAYQKRLESAASSPGKMPGRLRESSHASSRAPARRQQRLPGKGECE